MLQVEGNLHVAKTFFFPSKVNYTGMCGCMLLNAHFYICSATFGEMSDGD